jgi:hypothetical protein
MLQRELVLCSHEILSSKRDTVVLSALTRHPIYHPDVSSDSATTSTRGYTDGNKSGSDTVQRSDDITVDSTLASKRRIRFPMSIDNDQKTDESSVSQQLVTQRSIDRVPFSGKQIPNRSALVSRNLPEDAEKRLRYRKVDLSGAYWLISLHLHFIFTKYAYYCAFNLLQMGILMDGDINPGY